MAEARTDLEGRYDPKLELVEAEAVGRTTVLRSGLAEAKHREKSAAASLNSVQAELASARAELRSLQQRVANAESSVQQSREEALRRRTLEREHAPII